MKGAAAMKKADRYLRKDGRVRRKIGRKFWKKLEERRSNPCYIFPQKIWRAQRTNTLIAGDYIFWFSRRRPGQDGPFRAYREAGFVQPRCAG